MSPRTTTVQCNEKCFTIGYKLNENLFADDTAVKQKGQISHEDNEDLSKTENLSEIKKLTLILEKTIK